LDLLDKCGQHPLNFIGPLNEIVTFVTGQVVQIFRKEQMIFKLDSRPPSDVQETREFGIRSSAATFRDIRANR